MHDKDAEKKLETSEKEESKETSKKEEKKLSPLEHIAHKHLNEKYGEDAEKLISIFEKVEKDEMDFLVDFVEKHSAKTLENDKEKLSKEEKASLQAEEKAKSDASKKNSESNENESLLDF